MEWSLDFCLVCDRQTSGGPYCSQSCRLQELDTVHEPGPFSAATPAASYEAPRSPSLYEAGNSSSTSDILFSTRPSLSPSSSQTSLSSLQTTSSRVSKVPDRFQDDLRNYENCFDQVRDMKRRLTASDVRLS